MSKKPKQYFAWFVFTFDDAVPLLTTASASRAEAIRKWNGVRIFPLNGRKVRRCEIVLPKPAKKGPRR